VDTSADLLLLKVAIAPAFVGLVSVLALTYGHRAAGWLVALPINTATILIVLTLSEGASFAATAAVGALVGVVSLSAFAIGYGRSAPRFPWSLCLGIASAGFVTSTLILSAIPENVIGGLVAAVIAIGVVLLVVRVPEGPAPSGTAPKWEIPVRMATAAVLVFSVTTAADALGPRLSGLLSPIPVFTITLVIFTHSRFGPSPVFVFLNGLLLGLFSFAAFCAVVAVLLVPYGLVVSLGAGLVAFIGVYGLVRGLSYFLGNRGGNRSDATSRQDSS